MGHTAYEVGVRLVGSEMCIRDRTHGGPIYIRFAPIDSVLLAAYVGLELSLIHI